MVTDLDEAELAKRLDKLEQENAEVPGDSDEDEEGDEEDEEGSEGESKSKPAEQKEWIGNQISYFCYLNFWTKQSALIFWD